MTKKPVRTKIVALLTSVCTIVVMCGLPAFAFAADTGVTKEETVYVVTDSTGTQQDVIVSDHLVNKGKAASIADETTLSDIENVKGEETFKQNGDALTWDAEGNSIYYQGRSTEEIPVTMDVVYRLDNKVVSGSELQGKSGKVEIKINYENDAQYNGTAVPFLVMTGMVITDESFKNVKIDHGKVIDDGDKLLVVGLAAPGLAQTLDIGESDLGFGSSVTITGDADKFAVEDMMTIVTNSVFEDVDTDGIDLDYDDEIDALNKGAKALVDGSDQLYEGLDTLSDKMPTLKEGVKELKDGSKSLEQGTNDAKDGAQALSDGVVKLSSNLEKALNQILNGVTQLEDGSDTLHEGLGALKNGVDSAKGGLDQVEAGLLDASIKLNEGAGYAQSANGAISDANDQINSADDLIDSSLKALNTAHDNGNVDDATYETVTTMLKGAKQHTDGAKQYTDGASEAVSGTETIQFGYAAALGKEGEIYGGVDAVKYGLETASGSLGDDSTDETLINGAYSLNYGLNTLKNSISNNLDSKSELSQGLTALNKGSSDLAKGEIQLAGGAKQLADGMTELNDNTNTMVNGVYQLDKGAYKLRKGMSKLYKEGIKKIVEMYNDDLKGTLDSVDSMLDAGKGYKTFTKLPSGMDGNVKFIYKTDITQ